MNRVNNCFSFFLLACIAPAVGFAVDDPSDNIQMTTIEAVRVDGNFVVSVKTEGLKILARSLTIEGKSGPMTITNSPQGIEMKGGNVAMTTSGKIELQTDFTITKMDLIRIDIAASRNASRTTR